MPCRVYGIYKLCTKLSCTVRGEPFPELNPMSRTRTHVQYNQSQGSDERPVYVYKCKEPRGVIAPELRVI